MTVLTRADLTAALSAVTDPVHEAALLQTQQREVTVIRKRHRRVRNAINHGNPLSTAALDSVRGFSERTAQAALAIALAAYASGTLIAPMLATERAGRQEQRQGLTNGRNYVERNPPADTTDPARS